MAREAGGSSRKGPGLPPAWRACRQPRPLPHRPERAQRVCCCLRHPAVQLAFVIGRRQRHCPGSGRGLWEASYCLSLCESPSSTSVFSTQQENSQSHVPSPGREGEEDEDHRPADHSLPLTPAAPRGGGRGASPRESKVLRHGWVTGLALGVSFLHSPWEIPPWPGRETILWAKALGWDANGEARIF